MAARRFVSEFLLPLVKGGLTRRPALGPRAVERLVGGMLGPTEATDAAPVELIAGG